MAHIGKYVLEREIGRGSTGTVYLGRSRAGRAVAVKVLRPEATADKAADDRLRAAVEAARAVGGFHTAPVLDADTEADTPWFATDYVPGPSLAELLAARGPLGETELRRLATGLADALQSMHDRGLVHGDLKASDVLMAEDGPRVRDFGLRSTLDGRAAVAADDVRALGALLVTACGGDVSQLPGSLGATVQACLDGDAERRPDTDALIAAFHGAAPATEPAAPGAPPPPGPAGYTVPAGAPPAPGHAPAPPPAPPAPPGPPAPGAYATPPATPPGHPAGHPAGQTPPPTGGFGPPPGAPPAPHHPGAPTVPPGAAAGGPGVAAAAGEEPEFLAMDRKNDIVADAHGISFSMHGRSTDLPWQHIGFAQHRRDPHGSHFVLTLSLVLTNGAQVACQVSTRDRWEIEQWAAQLDAVLSRYLPRPQQ